MVLSSSSITTKNEYKPGRTMIVRQYDIVGFMVATGGGQMGRWARSKLFGSHGKRTKFIVVYQVCSCPNNKTGITTYHHLTFKSLIITLISNVMPMGDFILAEGQTGTI
jgi:hypothetical protein